MSYTRRYDVRDHRDGKFTDNLYELQVSPYALRPPQITSTKKRNILIHLILSNKQHAVIICARCLKLRHAIFIHHTHSLIYNIFISLFIYLSFVFHFLSIPDFFSPQYFSSPATFSLSIFNSFIFCLSLFLLFLSSPVSRSLSFPLYVSHFLFHHTSSSCYLLLFSNCHASQRNKCK